MQSRFKSIVLEAIRQNDRTTVIVEPRSYEELLHIFGIDTYNLEEEDNELVTFIYLATNYYKILLNKLQEKEYDITRSTAIHIDMNDFEVYIFYGNNGLNYKRSYYNNDANTITLYTKDLNTIKDDKAFRSNFIHEVTHFLSKNEDDTLLDIEHNYIKPEQDDIKYYTQPTELLSSRVSICDYLIESIKQNIITQITSDDLKNKAAIQKYIDKELLKIITEKEHIYRPFLNALSIDKKALQEFYTSIVEAVALYIQSNLKECKEYACYQDHSEWAKKCWKQILEEVKNGN